MGMAGAKGFGDMLLVNKTIQTLDVSDNGFGKMQEGDDVKLKSSGEACTISCVHYEGVRVYLASGKESSNINVDDIVWESQVPALCAGVAASPSLISVSTTFRHGAQLFYFSLLPSFLPCT